MSTIPTNKVNMSLDDIIKQSRKGKKHQNGRRNFGERRGYKERPRKFERNSNPRKDSNAGEKRTRLFVSNLQKELVNSELRV
jgi:hypothetical protein